MPQVIQIDRFSVNSTINSSLVFWLRGFYRCPECPDLLDTSPHSLVTSDKSHSSSLLLSGNHMFSRRGDPLFSVPGPGTSCGKIFMTSGCIHWFITRVGDLDFVAPITTACESELSDNGGAYVSERGNHTIFEVPQVLLRHPQPHRFLSRIAMNPELLGV